MPLRVALASFTAFCAASSQDLSDSDMISITLLTVMLSSLICERPGPPHDEPPSAPTRNHRLSLDRAANAVVSRPLQGLDDTLGYLLGVAEQHHRVVAIEEGVVDAGIAGGERALEEHDGAGPPNFEHRLAVERHRPILLRGRGCAGTAVA